MGRLSSSWLVTLGAVAVGVVILAGCGSEGESSASRCIAVEQTTLSNIAEGLTVSGGGSLRDGWAVRSEDFEQVYFVAAEMDGSGMEGDGEVGLWATNDLAGGLIFAVNSMAEEFSDWGSGGGTDAELTTSDDGADEALDCVGG